MLVTGSCHATDTLRCPNCGAAIALDACQCSKCGLRIVILRRPRNKNHRTEKTDPSGDSVIQKILVMVSISGRDCGSIAHISSRHCNCSSNMPSIEFVGCA